MNRTVFTMSDDGNLLITREARMGTPGAAKDRRRRSRFLERDHSYNPWVRKDRAIVRPGKPVPEKAERWVPYWQDGLLETNERAAINNLNAKMHAGLAEQTVEEIEAAIAGFEVPRGGGNMNPQERYLKEMDTINEMRRALDRRAMEALATLRSEVGATDIEEGVVYAAQS